jgi:DNA-binding ferritin-like protein (Dps family)
MPVSNLPQDLVDLFRQRAPVPGVKHTIRAATGGELGVGNTFRAAKGATFDTIWNTLKAMGLSAADAAKHLDSLIGLELDEELAKKSISERVGGLANAALLGLPNQLHSRIAEQESQHGTGSGFNDQNAMNIIRGVGKFAAMDILPGNEAMSLVHGTNAQGQPLTPEEVGQTVSQGLLKTMGLGWVKGGKAVGTPKASTLRKAITIGEIENFEKGAKIGKDIQKAIKANDADPSAATITSTVEPTPPSLENINPNHAAFKQGIADTPGFREVAAKVVQTDLFKKVVANDPEGRIFQHIADAIDNGALDEASMRKFIGVAEDLDMPLDKVTETAAKIFRESGSFAGKELQVLSEYSDYVYGRLAYDAAAGDRLAANALHSLDRAKESAQNTTLWSKATNIYRMVDQVRLGGLVSQSATAMRNLISQGVTGAVGLGESIISGSIEAVVGKLQGDGRSFGQYYGDAISHFTGFVSSLQPKKLAAVEEMLKATPLLRRELKYGSAYEIGNYTVGELLKGVKPKGAKDVVDLYTTTVTTLTRLQEAEFRRMFYSTRLEGNIKALGLNSFDELMAKLHEPELDPKFRTAIADAVEHSLKQTYSFKPEAGFGAGILKMYQAAPFLTAIATPFPRFLVNMWRWQMERSPTHWFNLFNKEFRDALFNGAENGFASRQAARQLSQATSGLVMLNAAWLIRNDPDAAGPKYYQFRTPGGRDARGDGQDQFIDIRSFQPFSSYAFIADIMKSVQDGTPLNVTANEFTDAIFGIRRVAEMPAFAVVDYLRGLNSDDPATALTALKTPVGQYLGGFFVPFRAIKDLSAALGDKEDAKQVDVQGQELTGPIRANLPGGTHGLPERVDPFTGQPQKTEHPLLRQLLGQNVTYAGKLEQMVAGTPGMSVSEMIGNHGSPEADNLVAAKLGQTLSLKVGDKTVGDVIAEKLEATPLTARKLVLGEMFRGLRQSAMAAAKAENPNAFIPGLIKRNLPGEMREPVRKIVRDQGLTP